MAGRPSTARSEISSAISDDGDRSRAHSGIYAQASGHQQGHMLNTSRSARNSAPGTASITTRSSRPTSPISQSTRTHVPSLTAQGFFRPMSSQRLQAQRLGRQRSGTPVPPPIEDTEGDVEIDGQSLSSSRQGPCVSIPQHCHASPSTRTDFSENVRGPSFETRLHNNATPRSHPQGTSSVSDQESNDQPDVQQRPQPLPMDSQASNQRGLDPPQKSSISFRSGFGLDSNRHTFESGHQHLSSTATSPRYTIAGTAPPAKASSLGRNYEYFKGNTFFWWGGRLQNSRDRPINIATGILLILPAILFFVFS
jgi:palmitoyltransferase ZDHHC9/14/18